VADKLLFILTSVKQNPIQEIQGQLFGMSPSHANTWIHLLPPVVHRALAYQDRLPARTAEELAALLAATQSTAGGTSPLVGMRVLHGPSPGRKPLRNRKSMTVARKSAPRSKTSW
jgi:hypothetical protein